MMFRSMHRYRGLIVIMNLCAITNMKLGGEDSIDR